jgi:hypothetical protein
LKIGRHLLGLDHSGKDGEAMNDECWAAVFGVGFTSVPVPEPIADVFETIIQGSKKEIGREQGFIS